MNDTIQGTTKLGRLPFHRARQDRVTSMKTHTSRKRMATAISVFVVLASLSAISHATSGGVDKNGCHNSAKAGFHCHPERAKQSADGSSTGVLPGDRTQAERDKRLKRECKGRPNAGACLGYANP